MKLTFFLIALALVLLRLCYPTLEIWHSRHGQGTMIIKSDHYIQGIWWLGKIQLSDDERSIAEISPGGYLKFKENDTTMKAESDLQGKITYTLYNGREDLPLNDSGRHFIASQIQKMIRLGFFAEDRARKIYEKSGVKGLIAELSRIRMEGGRDQYLDLLFRSDSLTPADEIRLLKLAENSNDMNGRQQLLQRFNRERLGDSAVAGEWLSAVGDLDQANEKKDLLLHYIGEDNREGAGAALPPDRFDTVLAITRRFGSDYDEQEVYRRLADLRPLREHDSAYSLPWLSAVGKLNESYVKKDLLLRYFPADSNAGAMASANEFDQVIAITRSFQNSVDEQAVYQQLLVLRPLRMHDSVYALPWLNAVGDLNESYMKKDLLLRFLPVDSASGRTVYANEFDRVIAITRRFRNSVDEQEIYKRLADLCDSDPEWVSLIQAVGELSEDYMKTGLLLKIAPKMPRTDDVRSVYRSVARSIREDMDYGKVMRAVE
ncbi:MAG TPA: hypothetical protein VMH27_08130 [Puia sp.]|nr:hypothetical protein [Puia sp.]